MNSRMSCSRSDGRSRRIAYFAEDPGPQARLQPLRCRQIHRATENLGQSFTQGGELEKVRHAIEFNQDVDVAIRAGLAPRDGAEHANPSHAGTRQLGEMWRYPAKEFGTIHCQLGGEV